MPKPTLFISWSGDRGRALAKGFAAWIRGVLQSYDPFVSTGIESGADWWATIRNKLENAAHAIVIVTPESKDARWLNFEAGALSTQLDRRVCPYLLDMNPADLESPMTLFQARRATEDETLKLLIDLDSSLDASIGETTISSVFRATWPEFEKEVKRVGSLPVPAAHGSQRRPWDEKIDEMLSILRRLDRKDSLPPSYEPELLRQALSIFRRGADYANPERRPNQYWAQIHPQRGRFMFSDRDLDETRRQPDDASGTDEPQSE